jgi:hypothetical protein
MEAAQKDRDALYARWAELEVKEQLNLLSHRISAPKRRLRSFPHGRRWFFAAAEAGLIRDRPDQEPFHTRQSPRRRLRDSKVRKRPGPPRNGLAAQTCDKSSAAIRRVHNSRCRDQGRGRARRWRIERIVVRQDLPHLTNRWRGRREILAPNEPPPRERALARELHARVRALRVPRDLDGVGERQVD